MRVLKKAKPVNKAADFCVPREKAAALIEALNDSSVEYSITNPNEYWKSEADCKINASDFYSYSQIRKLIKQL